MKSITIVLVEKDGRGRVIPIRNDTPPRVAAEACQLAASQLLEEAIRAEMAEDKKEAVDSE